MPAITPIDSNNRIKAAGKRLIAGSGKEEDYVVLQNWRARHQHPLDIYEKNLCNTINVFPIDRGNVSQRLKREEAIVNKLKRESYGPLKNVRHRRMSMCIPNS